ncbi:MAG: (2Fe-2S)-binding protein [Chloroflexi bacterium]|nr:(2Fe-2S)-binding protein [Chloroflexota bacterium]
MAERIELRVNDRNQVVEVEPFTTLAECLRNQLGLIGVRVSCNQGDCGACTILVDGQPVNACMELAIEAEGRSVTTIEGLARNGHLHPIQQAFVEHHGMQCGFCTPGMIMVARALLESNPAPTEQEVKEALVGNICRCGSYPKIITSVLSAAQTMREG